MSHDARPVLSIDVRRFRHERKNDILTALLHRTSQISKIETVVILIFWILVIGAVLDYLADSLLPAAFSPMWRSVLLISANVILISYVFLPWSSKLMSKFKTRFYGSARSK